MAYAPRPATTAERVTTPDGQRPGEYCRGRCCCASDGDRHRFDGPLPRLVHRRESSPPGCVQRVMIHEEFLVRCAPNASRCAVTSNAIGRYGDGICAIRTRLLGGHGERSTMDARLIRL